MTVPLSTRVDPVFKELVIKQAEIHGMDIANFIRICLKEKLDSESKISLSETLVDQICFLKQIVFNCYDWGRDEALIKKEVEHLWGMIQINQDLQL